jgi:hypothetical protein
MPQYAVICRGLRFAKGGATAHIKRAGTAVRTRRPALAHVTEVAMTKAPTSLSLTQEDCEKAEPRQARILQKQVEQKIDPLEHKQRQRKERERKRETRKAGAKTFKACAEAYITAQEVGWTSPVYRRQWKDTLARFAYPVIGDLLVADVTKNHILQILRPLWATKTTTAKGLRARIATVLDYAAAQNYRPREGNPAAWEGEPRLRFGQAKSGSTEAPPSRSQLRSDRRVHGKAAAGSRHGSASLGVHDLNRGQILRGPFRLLVRNRSGTAPVDGARSTYENARRSRTWRPYCAPERCRHCDPDGHQG